MIKVREIDLMTPGKAFELVFVASLVECIPGTSNLLGTEDDCFQGTDCTVGHQGIRLDVTSNFAGKEAGVCFERVNSVMALSNVTLEFGIRTGNAVADFLQPVIVCGFTATPRFVRENGDCIISEIVERKDEFLATINTIFRSMIL